MAKHGLDGTIHRRLRAEVLEIGGPLPGFRVRCPGVWARPFLVRSSFPLPEFQPHVARKKNVCLIPALVSVSLLNVYTATKKKGTSFVEAITQLTPMFFFTAVAGLWVASPYSSLLSYQRLIEFAILLSTSVRP